MKKSLQMFVFAIMLSSFVLGQQAKIKVVPVSPEGLVEMNLQTNSVSSGLPIFANGTFCYLEAANIADANPVLTSNFTFVSKPSGSTAAFTIFEPGFVYFKADIKGEYKINLAITTATGADDTTMSVYAADFVGVGGFEGVAASFPQCMTCHATSFADIFNNWKVSGHAQRFKEDITTGGAFFNESCMKCHTTGYDHNVVAANNGFDDKAASLGWIWANFAPPSPNNWDLLVSGFSGLVNHANIGCESCHGPGSEHGGSGGNVAKIAISREVGACAQCHGEPGPTGNYPLGQYELSGHSEAIWSSSFAQGASSQNNNLQNCIRCHDAQGFVNFTKGQITNTTGMKQHQHEAITCATCHDPHGNGEEYAIRETPVGSDTLGNGFSYTEFGGVGQLCMNCHKSRRDGATYGSSTVSSSHWGPHHSVQTDVYLGKNAADFGVTYQSSNHRYAVGDACVTCHMAETPASPDPNQNKVGGHSWSMHNAETGYDNTASCESCHGPKESFEDFVAQTDYDGDGTVEPVMEEVDGLIHLLSTWLPPVGIDSISWTDIRDAGNVMYNKAYWNYQLIAYDGSKGMHNTKFAIDVLTKSIEAVGGVVPVELISLSATPAMGKVTLDWQTATETNNKGFEVERDLGQGWHQLAFIEGHGTTTEPVKYKYVDNLTNVTYGNVVNYRLKQIDVDGSVNYSKAIEVNFEGILYAYNLDQNYPNPFNPSTKITFATPVESRVTVKVYNTVGQEVAEIVNGKFNAGVHEATFNASALTSGVYFYAIDAKGNDGTTYSSVKKMVLMK